jgi:DNA-binding transcriptional LysR family regulator
MKFDLNDLQAFRAVAERGSFRRAAEALHLSQPAFSRRIEKLEDALGVQLLERTTRRVTLTTVGRDFARKVQQLLDDLDGTLLAIRGLAATRMGEVTVACVPSTVYYLVSEQVQLFRQTYPRVRVRVMDASANDVLGAVASGAADFGLNFLGAEEPEIEFHALFEERFVVACRRDHPLAGRRRVSWADLADHDFVAVSRNSGNRLLIDQALAGLRTRPIVVCEAQHISAVLGLVEAGLGVAAVPSLAMPRGEHPVLVSLPLDGPVVTRRLGLIRRRGRTLVPAAQELYDAFRAMNPPAVRRPRRVTAAPRAVVPRSNRR